MKQYKYTGLFRSAEGHEYSLTTNCDSLFQAFFLLTAEAIKSGRHYQLKTITDEERGVVTRIGDILKVSEIFD